jgi:hypothetical protein
VGRSLLRTGARIAGEGNTQQRWTPETIQLQKKCIKMLSLLKQSKDSRKTELPLTKPSAQHALGSYF